MNPGSWLLTDPDTTVLVKARPQPRHSWAPWEEGHGRAGSTFHCDYLQSRQDRCGEGRTPVSSPGLGQSQMSTATHPAWPQRVGYYYSEMTSSGNSGLTSISLALRGKPYLSGHKTPHLRNDLIMKSPHCQSSKYFYKYLFLNPD